VSELRPIKTLTTSRFGSKIKFWAPDQNLWSTIKTFGLRSKPLVHDQNLWSTIKIWVNEQNPGQRSKSGTIKIWVNDMNLDCFVVGLFKTNCQWRHNFKPIYKIWMKKPQKKQKNGIALEFIWLVYRSSNMSKQRCFNGFPRTETKIGQRWKFETYQKEQRAVKKLSTDLPDGVSYNFDGLKQTKLRPPFSRPCIQLKALTIRRSNLLIPLAV
jgi:hypothetical protein